MSTLIEVENASGIATIKLNRPEKRNAMSDDMRSELIAALEQLSVDRAVRAVVLTGNGKGFCAGGDVAGMERRLEAPQGEVAFNGWSRQQRVHHCVSLLHNMPKPTIAAVNGAAAGLGADTALCCDFVMVSPAASFTWSYIKRGLIPDGGGLYFLPRRVGLARAKELIFSGRTIDAEEALKARRRRPPGRHRDTARRGPRLGRGAVEWFRYGARPRQDAAQSVIREIRRGSVQERQSGSGHLLHEHRA